MTSDRAILGKGRDEPLAEIGNGEWNKVLFACAAMSGSTI